MLQENEDVISFCPGFVEQGNNKVTLGRIMVHDRLKVEANILPRYFNHSSFASLRRQLNYFSFARLGKGRQRGATYCNESVMELEDILRLKRRSTTSAPPRTCVKTSSSSHNVDEDGNRSRSLKHAPRVSISSMEELDQNAAIAAPPPPPPSKRARHSLFVDITTSRHHQTVSDSEDSLPLNSSSSCNEQQQQQQLPNNNNSNRTHHRRITLDLTTPLLLSNNNNNNNGEDDILAGSQALLSFARAFVH